MTQETDVDDETKELITQMRSQLKYVSESLYRINNWLAAIFISLVIILFVLIFR